MKFLAVFAAVLALAAGTYSPVSSWTLQELDQALSDPNTDPALIPYLVDGLNTIMANLMVGDSQATVLVAMPINEVVTLDELVAALHNPSTDPAVMPYLEGALQELMVAMNNGQEEATVLLEIPAMNINIWSLEQLSAALENPETDPELTVYLEHALNNLMSQIFAGEQVSTVAVITPPGVLAAAPETPAVPVVPQPVIPEITEPVGPLPPSIFPIAPETPEILEPVAPVNPTPVVTEPVVAEPVAPTASAPLVQLIINVNANQQSVGVNPVVAAEESTPGFVDRPHPVSVPVVPSPVIVVDEPETVSPVGVVETPAVVSPIAVVETPAVVSPIAVVETPAVVSPIAVVETPAVVSPIAVVDTPATMPIAVVNPIVPASPIDVIAVAAPEVNPIDIIAPVPAVAGSAQGILV